MTLVADVNIGGILTYIMYMYLTASSFHVLRRETKLLNIGGVHVSVSDASPEILDLQKGYAYKDPHCAGSRHGIVHLFEWKWSDIAAECERFLGPYGFCGVQTSPASENRMVTSPDRPWWERYQPVSYKMTTRSGSEQDFRDMVSRCAAQGVRIYVDVVLNHMTGSGGKGTGTAGTYFDADSLQFPGVPYGPTDFNSDKCFTGDGSIHNYNNAEEIRNCNLVSLLDLKLAKSYVRDKVTQYLNHLVDLGVAGFRVDAAKHMWPGDLTVIMGKVKDVQLGGRPFVVQEVIDMGNEAVAGTEYLSSGRITNFKFGAELARVFR
ncbi:alpha-amylase [Elysia marginata]|uniref:Alpha-amylase n=1 Tax=Elysia marginata TaxID=1093978 RepID=A0AAV4EML9_9GAST|nr:alpha-amylase [Elysia marginata]